MEQQNVKEMSIYQVLHELCTISGWRYEGPIRYDDGHKPKGSSYRYPSGECTLITFDGEVYLRGRVREDV